MGVNTSVVGALWCGSLTLRTLRVTLRDPKTSRNQPCVILQAYMFDATKLQYFVEFIHSTVWLKHTVYIRDRDKC